MKKRIKKNFDAFTKLEGMDKPRSFKELALWTCIFTISSAFVGYTISFFIVPIQYVLLSLYFSVVIILQKAHFPKLEIWYKHSIGAIPFACVIAPLFITYVATEAENGNDYITHVFIGSLVTAIIAGQTYTHTNKKKSK